MSYILAPFVFLGLISKILNKTKKTKINTTIVQSKTNTSLYQLTKVTPENLTCNINGSNHTNEIYQNQYKKART